jgi:glycosyltransferase involved in cell wall biosynthesis
MKCLILAAGRFGDEMMAAIQAGREPRLDVFELARELSADVIDYGDAERSTNPAIHAVLRSAGKSAAVALLGFDARRGYDTFLTTGEDIGLPLSALLAPTRAPNSHTMIAHTLHPLKKRLFFKVPAVVDRVDRFLVYSTSEERLLKNDFGVPPDRVQRIYYHADETFFRPQGTPVEPNLLCAAGQLLRDYDCLMEAVRELPVKVQIAAGSPWIEKSARPAGELPPNVTWGKLNRYELRELYARAAIAVVPIKQNPYQTGIATILEMMAMGKCVVATRTQGQTDTIVGGETGVYVPPGDPAAMRAAIQRLLENPADIDRIGRAARRFIEENAGLDRFVSRVAEATRAAFAAREARPR